MTTEDADRASDPYETWRQLYEANERAWTSALEQAMNSPEFNESSGKMLETMLAAQKSVRESMRTYLETMNVPTREDIARLGELVIGIEEKIDQLADDLGFVSFSISSNLAGKGLRAEREPGVHHYGSEDAHRDGELSHFADFGYWILDLDSSRALDFDSKFGLWMAQSKIGRFRIPGFKIQIQNPEG